MRCLLIVLVVQGVVSLQLGVVHLRQPAPSRALVVLSEVLLASDAAAVTCESSHKMGVRAQNPVVSEEECIVNAENAAEAEACKDPPLKRGEWDTATAGGGPPPRPSGRATWDRRGGGAAGRPRGGRGRGEGGAGGDH